MKKPRRYLLIWPARRKRKCTIGKNEREHSVDGSRCLWATRGYVTPPNHAMPRTPGRLYDGYWLRPGTQFTFRLEDLETGETVSTNFDIREAVYVAANLEKFLKSARIVYQRAKAAQPKPKPSRLNPTPENLRRRKAYTDKLKAKSDAAGELDDIPF